MSKERLEEIPYNVRTTSHGEVVIDSKEYQFLYQYAIEQTERVEELDDILEQDARQGVLEVMYEENKQYRDGIKELKNYLESTIPMIPYNEKPLILTESLKIINEILEGES